MKLTSCLIMTVALLPLAGCGEGASSSAEAPAEAERLLDTQARAEAASPVEEAPDSIAPRIYYDLTRYDWYRRGEPLVVEGRQYLPAGELVAAPLQVFSHLGDFEGVDYYGRVEGSEDVLFVPVFERYWLPFAAQGTRRAD